MLIHWQDKDYELDFSDLTIRQAETIEKETGQTIGAWLGEVGGGFDPSSALFLPMLKVIYWLMLAQNGDATPIGAVDFPVLGFSQAFMAAANAEAAAAGVTLEEAPADPTQGAPSPGTASLEPPTPADGTTSPDSAAPSTAPG